MLTPKPREAVLSAFHAPDHALARCCGGYFDRTPRPFLHGPAPVVTVRTANTLVEMGLADYDDPFIPSMLRLTDSGVAEATYILQQSRAA